MALYSLYSTMEVVVVVVEVVVVVLVVVTLEGRKSSGFSIWEVEVRPVCRINR